jgi:hypothetical protein
VQISGDDLGTQIFEFNTVAGNRAQTLGVAGISCNTTPAFAGSGTVIFANLPNTASQVSGNCNWVYSDIDSAAPLPGEGNVNDDPLFVDGSGGDYHIQSSSPCVDAADPNAAIPVDFDGDERPNGARHDIGADELTE